MIVKITGTCAYEDCDRPATDIAAGRFVDGRRRVACYCLDHARDVSEAGNPEYADETCPNCGCHFGVN